jgi:hypothetical protein
MKTREERVLERLISEERALALAEPDWSRVEAGLEARLKQPAPLPKRSPALAVAAFGVVALAAAATLFVQRDAPSTTAAGEPATRAAAASNTLDGDELAHDHELEARLDTLQVEHAGRARWSLLPGGRARVRREGEVIVVTLDSGSVDAQVEPRERPETFVVEAGEVRVAVHGTAFRVTRSPSNVAVDVREGVVSVQRAGAAAPSLLRAPAQASFAERLGPTAASASARSSALHGPAQRTRAGAGGPTALVDQPGIDEVERGVSRLLEAAQGCFVRHTAAGSGVQVSTQTNLRFVVQPGGAVQARSFEPPLAPAVESCLHAELAKLRFAPSRYGIELSRSLELRR